MIVQKLLKIEHDMFNYFFDSVDGKVKQKLYFELKVNLAKYEQIWISLDNKLKISYHSEND